MGGSHYPGGPMGVWAVRWNVLKDMRKGDDVFPATFVHYPG